MNTLKSLVIALGVFSVVASAQAATINCTPASQRAHIASLEGKVQTLTTQVQALENQAAFSPQQSVEKLPVSHLPLGDQFGIATGG